MDCQADRHMLVDIADERGLIQDARLRGQAPGDQSDIRQSKIYASKKFSGGLL